MIEQIRPEVGEVLGILSASKIKFAAFGDTEPCLSLCKEGDECPLRDGGTLGLRIMEDGRWLICDVFPYHHRRKATEAEIAELTAALYSSRSTSIFFPPPASP